jgi:hypothetical protein
MINHEQSLTFLSEILRLMSRNFFLVVVFITESLCDHCWISLRIENRTMRTQIKRLKTTIVKAMLG